MVHVSSSDGRVAFHCVVVGGITFGVCGVEEEERGGIGGLR